MDKSHGPGATSGLDRQLVISPVVKLLDFFFRLPGLDLIPKPVGRYDGYFRSLRIMSSVTLRAMTTRPKLSWHQATI